MSLLRGSGAYHPPHPSRPGSARQMNLHKSVSQYRLYVTLPGAYQLASPQEHRTKQTVTRQLRQRKGQIFDAELSITAKVHYIMFLLLVMLLFVCLFVFERALKPSVNGLILSTKERLKIIVNGLQSRQVDEQIVLVWTAALNEFKVRMRLSQISFCINA